VAGLGLVQYGGLATNQPGSKAQLTANARFASGEEHNYFKYHGLHDLQDCEQHWQLIKC